MGGYLRDLHIGGMYSKLCFYEFLIYVCYSHLDGPDFGYPVNKTVELVLKKGHNSHIRG